MYSGRMQQAADHSVDNIITDNHFLGKSNETYERYVFNTRKQKACETVDDYVAALCTLASTCNFCDCLKDSLLRDRIVLGIKDSSARKRLLQEADLNLETCIAMCRAAEVTPPSQPVKTEDSVAVQAGSVSSAGQRPCKKEDFSQSLGRCDQMVSPDETDISEVNFNTELDDSDDDSALQWTTEHQSSGFPSNRTGRNKLEPVLPMDEDSPSQPSAVYGTVQPVSDNASLLSLDSKYPCYLCSAAFVLVSSLELHLASVHGEKLHMVLPGPSTPDKCDAGDCSKTTMKKKVNDTDADEKDGEKRGRQHVCDVCRKCFLSPSKLNRHKLIHTMSKKVNDKDSGEKDGQKKNCQHVCDVCTKRFITPSKLNRHKLIHNSIKPFECDVCRKRFRDASYFRAHKLTHSGHDQTHSSCKSFVCDVCSKMFTKASHLKRHKLIHSSRDPFVCDVCGKSYVQACSLEAHKMTHASHKPDLCDESYDQASSSEAHKMAAHSDPKSFVCDVCSKGFSSAIYLTEHSRVHTGERPFKCPHCDSDFNRSGNLHKHIKSVHEGARPHLCDVCGAGFSTTNNLTVHRRIHTGEKPHVCSFCGKGFARPNSLARHHMTHTGEKPHVCSDCGKGFNRTSHLAVHHLIHTGQKPYSCPICLSAFRQSTDLKRHIQNRHQ